MVKNKSTIIIFVLALVLALGMSTTAFAEENIESTTATVSFESDEMINKLELVTAPAFKFGENTLPAGGTDITAQEVSGDLRIKDTTGKNVGWDVTATMSTFSNGSINNSLPGAYITLKDGTATKIGSGNSASPIVPNNIKLTAGAQSTTNIVNAAENAGIGEWSMNWVPEKVSLTVLDIPAVGANTATINWTLTSGPA